MKDIHCFHCLEISILFQTQFLGVIFWKLIEKLKKKIKKKKLKKKKSKK